MKYFIPMKAVMTKCFKVKLREHTYSGIILRRNVWYNEQGDSYNSEVLFMR
jgi:hypothetical protein